MSQAKHPILYIRTNLAIPPHSQSSTLSQASSQLGQSVFWDGTQVQDAQCRNPTGGRITDVYIIYMHCKGQQSFANGLGKPHIV